MADKPTWRRAVEALDAKVSGRLDSVVRNDNFAIAVGLLLRGRREVREQLTRASSSVLHALNLPSKRDLDRLLRHVAALEREVLALGDTPAPTSAPSPAPSSAARRSAPASSAPESSAAASPARRSAAPAGQPSEPAARAKAR